MSRKTKTDLLWITLIAFLVQAFWAARLQHPTYFDAYYYTTNGRQLASGEGWQEWIIWQYLDQPEGFPTPSHTYWMPLTSMIAAAGYLIGGDGFRSAQAPFFLMAVFLPWMAYAISRQLSPQERWQARAAALFTAAGGYYTAYWSQPSTFVLYAWTGGGCLLALGWAASHSTQRGREATGAKILWAWLIAGVLAGLSHLARADGLLLVGVGGLVWLWQIKDQRLKIKDWQAILRFSIFNLLPFLAGYFLIMTPWFVHMWQVTGQPMSIVGTQTMFITEYNDVFAYNRQFTLSSYLDWGLWNILVSKAKATSLAVQTFIAVTGITFVTAFFVWGWIKLARTERTKWFLRPFTLYTIILYMVMAWIFTFPGQRGSLLHSSSALWPWAMALSAAGIAFAVEAVAKRLKHWQPEKSKPLFAILFIIVVYVITLIVSGTQPLKSEQAEFFKQVGEMMPEGTAVMVGDPPAFHYHTGLPTAVLPNEPPERTIEAMRQYGVEYLILDSDRTPPMADFYEGKVDVPELELVQTFNVVTLEGEAGIAKLYRLTE